MYCLIAATKHEVLFANCGLDLEISVSCTSFSVFSSLFTFALYFFKCQNRNTSCWQLMTFDCSKILIWHHSKFSQIGTNLLQSKWEWRQANWKVRSTDVWSIFLKICLLVRENCQSATIETLYKYWRNMLVP